MCELSTKGQVGGSWKWVRPGYVKWRNPGPFAVKNREMRRTMFTRRRSGGVLLAALVAALAFVLATVYSSNALATSPTGGAVQSTRSTAAAAKIDKAVTDQLTQTGSATFFAVLTSEANLTSVAQTGRAGGKRTADVYNTKVAY